MNYFIFLLYKRENNNQTKIKWFKMMVASMYRKIASFLTTSCMTRAAREHAVGAASLCLRFHILTIIVWGSYRFSATLRAAFLDKLISRSTKYLCLN